MNKKDAVKYLERKGKLSGKTEKEQEVAIKEVMKEGKIYGDPIVELDL